MPKHTKNREKIEAEKLSKSFLKRGSGTAIAKARGTSPQNENEKLRRKPVRDAIQRTLDSPKYRKRWLAEMLEGAHESEKSISAAILVQKDGTVIKADEQGGIMIPDRQARHKFLHDLGLAMGALKIGGNNVVVADGGKMVFQDIQIKGKTASELARDINNRLAKQFER